MSALWPWILLAATMLKSATGVPLRPDAIAPAGGVRDPVFAYLIGLVETNAFGQIQSADIEDAVRRAGRKSPLPYRHLSSLTRTKEEGVQAARVDALFREGLNLPIPYRILGYPPGHLRASKDLCLKEWDLGRMSLEVPADSGNSTIELTDIRLFGVATGTLWVDIDGWLDALVGGKLDDTRITGLILFRHGGDFWGLAVGYNRDWKGRSGLMNFREDQIRFPSPAPLKSVGWKMRQILEAFDPTLRPDSLRLRVAER